MMGSLINEIHLLEGITFQALSHNVPSSHKKHESGIASLAPYYSIFGYTDNNADNVIIMSFEYTIEYIYC